MENSLLFNRDIFKNETSLEAIFDKYTTLPDTELGYIRNQTVWSNTKSQMIFYYNLNDTVLEKFEDFCMSFGFYLSGEYVFYSYPSCGCNNPSTIYVQKPVEASAEFVEWFKKKELNESNYQDKKWHHNLKKLDWCRMNKTDDRWGYHVYKIDNDYFTPFSVCDELLWGGGCAAALDMGYIRRNI